MLKTFETENYVFYFDEKSTAERDIEKIAVRQETGFNYICDILGVNFGEKIYYWLCESPEDVGHIYENKYGDFAPCNGFSEEPAQVYAVYNDRVNCTGPHEDAHLISYKLCKPSSMFLSEGLATFFDGTWGGIENTTWAHALKRDDPSLSIIQMMSNEAFIQMERKVTYPIAGAFTAYLILRYGRDRYIYFYRCPDFSYHARAREAFGKNLDEVERDFWNYLEMMSFSKEMLVGIKKIK